MQVLGCKPFKKSSEIEEVFGVVSKIVFGPNFEWEISEVAEERLVMKITGCPLLKKAQDAGQDSKELSEMCQAHCRSAVENLNPEYTQSYTKKMCSGDLYCENVIALKK